MDTSRIVRSDYAGGEYARLGAGAMRMWRGWGDGEGEGKGKEVYVESGLCLVADEEGKGWGYVRDSLENVRMVVREGG